MSDYRLKIGDSACMLQWGQLDPKFQGEPCNHSSCHKTRINDLSCGIRMWSQFSFVLSQITHLTDGQTDSFLETRPPCIQCSMVKIRNQAHGGKKPREINLLLVLYLAFTNDKKQLIFSDTQHYGVY